MTAPNPALGVWKDPDNNEVHFYKSLIEETCSRLDSTRETVFESAIEHVQVLTSRGEHRLDDLAAALMEAGIHHGLARWGEETVRRAFEEALEAHDDVLIALINVPHSIVIDQITRERLSAAETQ